MVIAKYNCLASYTKQMQEHFSWYMKKNRIYQNKEYTLKNFRDGKIIQGNNFKSLRFLETINLINNDEIDFVFFEVLEDIPILSDDVIGNFLKYIPKNKKVKVLITLPDPFNRIKSLVMRSGIKIVKSTTIDDILKQTFNQHISYSKTKFDNIEHINFNRIMLIDDFERLVYMHNDGLIELICLNEKSISNPSPYFNHLGLTYIPIEVKVARRTKTVTVDKLSWLRDFNAEKENIIKQRYSDIYSIIEQNKVKIFNV